MAARDSERAAGGEKSAALLPFGQSRRDIQEGLQTLNPEIPWTHLFDLGGCTTISRQRDEKWYRKGEGLRRFGEIAVQLARTLVAGQSIAGKTVLDLGCGEGGHAIMFAQAGAGRVLAIDGRDLAIDRARFAARALRVDVEFRTADVRTLDVEAIGTFDIVLCSGILHHIEREQWFPFLKKVARLTADTAIFYTHVANEQLRTEHKLHAAPIERRASQASKIRKIVRSLLRRHRGEEEFFDGYLYREHRDDAPPEDRTAKMRASLDNAQSFWATEEAVVQALRKAGFAMVFKVQWPHMFREQWARDTRQIIVARKAD